MFWEINIDIALTCKSEPVMDAVYIAVVGSARTRLLDVGSGREDRSSDECNVGETRQSFSAQKMTAFCTLIICPNRVTWQHIYIYIYMNCLFFHIYVYIFTYR